MSIINLTATQSDRLLKPLGINGATSYMRIERINIITYISETLIDIVNFPEYSYIIKGDSDDVLRILSGERELTDTDIKSANERYGA